ncbi:uncharacterized protein LOC110106302 [Dendrobium catenatum]|uniref:Uncharacterized protein n=1 Tax=Dendrobium catenatum TaxID=906689 RepID=A0A2I0W9F9_9ASPA|nr:uncharacterized protein LOC110106302 [Dendrobium catenatum]PKU72297.1 hypothetical protein MA16_Dca006297 [Dendrobium catenatum]
MASFVTGKMKRKGVDEVFDDFSDLSFSAPALKIRRLDAELPPIMEERDPIGRSVLEPQLLKGDMGDAVPDMASVMKEEVFPPTVNEERALVLYKPLHSNFVPSLTMDPELISGLKDPSFWPGYQNLVEEDFVEEQQSSSINRLALIPWVPSNHSASRLEVSSSENGTVEEVMEEGADGESMEIDGGHGHLVEAGFGSGSFRQWQQHCMIPEHTHFTSTPILGSW